MNSKSTINLVILFLGAIALAVVVGGFVLAYQGETIPTELVGLGGTALGAVAGILAKTGTEPIPVVSTAPLTGGAGGLNEDDFTKLGELLKGAIPAEPAADEGGPLVAVAPAEDVAP